MPPFTNSGELEEAELSFEDVANLDLPTKSTNEDATVSQQNASLTESFPEEEDLDVQHTGMGLDGDEDESFDPVYARRALLEMQEREKEKQRNKVYDNDEYYRWDDPMTDLAEQEVDPARRQWGEAQ